MPRSASCCTWESRRRSARMPACTRGVQRLHPAVEALGEAGQVLDLGHRQAEALDQRGRAAGRDQRDAGVVQAADELLEPGLVVDRDERSPDRRSAVSSCPKRTFLSVIVKPSRTIRPTESTSICRSATLIRSCSDSTVSSSSTGTTVCATIGPVSTPAVDDEERGAGDLHAVGERVGRAVHARERRQQRGVGVDVAAGVALEEGLAGQLHEAGGDDQVGLVLADGVGHGQVPVLAGVVVLDPLHEGRDARPARRARAPRCRRGRRRRRPPRRRTPGRRRRRAGPGGWCRCRTRARRGARAQRWARP